MTMPLLPAEGSTDWYDHYSAMDSAVRGFTGAGLVGGVALDSFAGATDDAKLTAALTYVAAQTVKPPIVFSNRRYDFSQTNRQVFSGMKLSGAFAHGNQQRSANSIPNDIRFSGSGTWWTFPASGNVFDLGFYGLSFQGNSNAQFMATGNAIMWTSVFRDLGFNLWKHVLGNPTTKALLTAVLFDGWWNVNNSYNTAFTLGGSDNNLWMQGMLLDSEPAFMADGAYHCRFEWLGKTSVGPIYNTCEQNSGILVDGPDGSANPISFFGNGRIEGRNEDTPCFGSVLRIDGGSVAFRDWWFAFGASNIAGSGHSGEGGLITMTGGKALFDGATYARATGVAETVPFIYQTGGELRVRNTWACSEGGSWTGKPRVRSLGGTADLDDTVTLVSV
jgi:hypothetical protein